MKRFLLLFIGAVLLCIVASAQNENPLYEKGYYGNIELDVGSTFGFSADAPDRGLNAGILTSHGYSSGSGLYVGAGAGLIFNTEHYSYISVPVFADIKYSFVDNDFSPFVSCKIGTVINEELGAGVYCAQEDHLGIQIRNLSRLIIPNMPSVQVCLMLSDKHLINISAYDKRSYSGMI